MGFTFPAPDSEIRVKFPKTVTRERRNLSKLTRQKDFSNRTPVEGITIDGGAIIFVRDDGINLIPMPNGAYRVQLHIADVSEFISDESPHFNEALKRCFTVYRYRIAQHMLPRETGKLLSLEEGKSRPSITFEIDLDRDFDTISGLRVFPSVFANKMALGDKSFKQHFLSHGSEQHDILHYQYSFARGLLEKRIGKDAFEAQNNGNIISDEKGEGKITEAYYVILGEISRLINIQLAQLVCRNDIDFLFSQYNEGQFKYSTQFDDANGSLTRIGSPLRRSVDLILLNQIKGFVTSDGSAIPYSKDFLRDLAVFFNNRTEYIEKAIEKERATIDELRQERRVKSAIKSPHLLTEDGLKKIYDGSKAIIDSGIEAEVLRRCEHNLLGLSTMILIFFNTQNSDLARCIMEKIRRDTSYVSFLSISKLNPEINHKISIYEDEYGLKSVVTINIGGYSFYKEEYVPLEQFNGRLKSKYTNAVKRKLQLEAKKWILDTFYKYKFS